MDTQNDNIQHLIAKTIRKAGYEKDMRDLETLKAFTANIKRRNRIRRLLISVTSVAALLALLFSLNIYHDNRIMDNAFITYYAPLEYDQELVSRGSDSVSSELMSAMNAYLKKDYKIALQEFNSIQSIDNNFLIYKAICLIETKQLPEAINLLEQLVSDGEGTEYYQQAYWYLAISLLRNHEKEEAMQVLEKIVNTAGIYGNEASTLIKCLK